MNILLFPFKLVLNIVELVFKLTGRLIAIIIGLLLMIIGGVLCLTIVGGIVGVPLAIFGLILLVKGFF
ncbi:hypothetical protein [Serpentinicella alkaliphila]|uniref:Uncharacterized protein n=1 Tax=Serpentinicella alkaliphila TaxID=1734049 RepID=A0A4R2ST07_9FIRM|nr:hypothetical protein [Serpentinicella alkaliphila]QUH25754.1 hypothetical protein HZR23_08405 [Serpentinicella alkaliphila]TCP93497.1 hypothetical protein EDD79_10764 [Serpentinicella alkaliphila]